MPTRDETIQAFLDLHPEPSYLEIGVQNGVTFHKLRAARKVAVDPNFLFGQTDRETGSEYHDLTSDQYFSQLDWRSPPFHVIFLDGLHTCEQTLRDLMNSVHFLVPQGVIVIDDIIPSSYQASLPSTDDFAKVWEVSGGSVDWMGDVYKLLFFVESYMPSLAYATTGDNHGQLVLWRGPRNEQSNVQRSFKAIGDLAYKDVIVHSREFNKMDLNAIVTTIEQQRRTIT